MTPEQIARIAHEVNRGYCAAIGDNVADGWDQIPEAERTGKITGVQKLLETPEMTPEQMHEAWLASKTEAGWTFADTLNAKKKQHPCMRPFAELAPEQRIKDSIFCATVKAAAAVPTPEPERIEVQVEKIVEVEKIVSVGMMPVKYIGHRARYGDGVYGSGLFWHQGETVMVPDELAVKLLRHTEVWTRGNEADVSAPQSVRTVDTETEEETESVRIEIASMEKDALEAFARDRFQVTLDKNQPVEALRMEVTGLVDRFGVS